VIHNIALQFEDGVTQFLEYQENEKIITYLDKAAKPGDEISLAVERICK